MTHGGDRKVAMNPMKGYKGLGGISIRQPKFFGPKNGKGILKKTPPSSL
jgi:hypothetical protein